MSYYTQVEFHFASKVPSFAVIEECARAHFDGQGYAVEAILDILRDGWDDGKAEFNRMHCADFEGLMRHVSSRFPEQHMAVRGSGEEWRDLWLREFVGGELVFGVGPFLDGDKPVFFRAYFGDAPSA